MQEGRRLGCETAQAGRHLPTSQEPAATISYHVEQIPPKRWSTSTNLHGAIAHDRRRDLRHRKLNILTADSKL
jgi:hypothetical protein